MKNIYLVRHGQPKPGHPLDATRPLTTEGKRQATQVASWLRGFVGRVDIAISSPMARALETAEIIAPALGCHIATTRMVEPTAKPQDMWDDVVRLAAMAADVLVVGHDPALSNLVGRLTGWRAPEGAEGNPLLPEYPGIRFDWGSVAHLKMTGDAAGVLQWLVTVPIVEKPAEVTEVEEAALAFARTL